MHGLCLTEQLYIKVPSYLFPPLIEYPVSLRDKIKTICKVFIKADGVYNMYLMQTKEICQHGSFAFE